MMLYALLAALLAILVGFAGRHKIVAGWVMLLVLSLRLMAGRPSLTRLPKRHPDHAYLTPNQLRALEVELGYEEPSEPLSDAPERAAALHRAMVRRITKPGQPAVRSLPQRSTTPPKPPPLASGRQPKPGSAAYRAEYERGVEEARDRLREIGQEAQVKAAKRRINERDRDPNGVEHLSDVRLVALANATTITNMARGRDMTPEEGEQWMLLAAQVDELDQRIKDAMHREEAVRAREMQMGRDPRD